MQEEYVVSSRDVATWVRERAILGHTLQVEVDDKWNREDMESLRDMVGDARIVALGESTYGTRDLFLLKQRLSKFFIEKLGFTLFALPAPWSSICAINAYVYDGIGDPRGMIHNLYDWQWMTQEMLEFIHWLRKHNEKCTPDARVSIVGLDCIGYVPAAMDNVLDYLTETEPDWASVVQDLYQSFRFYCDDPRVYANLDRAARKECRAQLQQVYDGLITRQSLLTRLSSDDEFMRVLQNAGVILQAEEIYVTHQPSLQNRFMADNVAWLLETYRPQARMVLWTHNSDASLLGLDQQATTLCACVLERYQDELLSIGCSFYQGSFYAQDARQPEILQKYNIEDVPDDSFETVFAMTGLSTLVLDMRELDLDDACARWFTKQHFGRYVRRRYVEQQSWQPFHLLKSFDIFAFVQRVGPASLLPQAEEVVSPLPMQPANLDFSYGLDDWTIRKTADHHIVVNTTDDINVCFYSSNPETQKYCLLEQKIQARKYLNTCIRLRAEMTTQDVRVDASIWLRAISRNEEVLLLDMDKVSGTTGWQAREVMLDIPPDCYTISLCIVLNGPGSAWFADLQLDVLDE